MAWRDYISFGKQARTVRTDTGIELTTEKPKELPAPIPGLDSGGAPIPVHEKRISAFSEIGVTGLQRHGGYIYEEILRELSGYRAVKIYKEMGENEAIIGALMFAIEMLVRSVTWDVKPAGKESHYLKDAERIRENMDDMSHTWVDLVVEVLSMLQYGWSWHETVYKIRNGPSEDPAKPGSRHKDGLIGWRKIPIRAQDSLLRWEFDESGGVQAMIQVAGPAYQVRYLPIAKSLLFRPKAHKNNPQGYSILRNAYLPWYFKKNIQRIEAIGVERDLAGLPTFGLPPRFFAADASAEDRALFFEYQKMVTNIRRDEAEGVLYPLAYDKEGHELYKLSLLSTGGRRQFETSPIIARYNQEMAVTSLADFILIGHGSQDSGGGKGGTALVDNKTSIFSLALGSWLDAISDVFNRFEIPRLFKLNGWKTDKLPEITHGKIEQVDLAELGNFITQMAGAGMALFPDGALENVLRNKAGLPERAEKREDTSEPMTLAEQGAAAAAAAQQQMMGQGQPLPGQKEEGEGEMPQRGKSKPKGNGAAGPPQMPKKKKPPPEEAEA